MAHVPGHFDYTQLSVAQRLELIGDIWDSIEAEQMPPLTEEQRAELDRRIADHEQTPECAIPWEQVKSEIKQQLRDAQD